MGEVASPGQRGAGASRASVLAPSRYRCKLAFRTAVIDVGKMCGRYVPQIIERCDTAPPLRRA